MRGRRRGDGPEEKGRAPLPGWLRLEGKKVWRGGGEVVAEIKLTRAHEPAIFSLVSPPL
jgi:hypothetical protein